VLGPWFGVLAWGHDPRPHLDARARQVLRALDARLVVVRPPTQLGWGPDDDEGVVTVSDATGALKAWFDGQRGSVVVLRPDRFVAAIVRPTALAAELGALGDVLGLAVGAVPAQPAEGGGDRSEEGQWMRSS
jgi:3-(3-hydroxy-phenyl)propionate hydroxylase